MRLEQIHLEIFWIKKRNFELKYRFITKKISTGFQYQSNTSKKDVNTGLSTDFNANTFILYLSAGTRNRIVLWKYR
jgi:hypothetical protein